jgi:excisionase family DNA binding protein
MAEQLLTLEQVAEQLQTSPRHIRYLWQSRAIGAVKVGHLVRFSQTDVDAYVRAHRVPAVVR